MVMVQPMRSGAVPRWQDGRDHSSGAGDELGWEAWRFGGHQSAEIRP